MTAQVAAIIASTGLFGLMCFQLLLATGLPIGHLAWGGKYRILPTRLRIASVFSACVFVFASILVLEKANVFSLLNNSILLTYGVWILTGFFGLNTASNLASRSKWEKRIMAPIALSLCILCIIIAITSG
ncbi:MAG: hypothetical protein HN837_07025 [Chloroflexi bacterium]|nr:hypothetical protein [Chloroflexota bacterium]MBT7290224.1 hypothetical protein [Chloroflexota bacterium]